MYWRSCWFGYQALSNALYEVFAESSTDRDLEFTAGPDTKEDKTMNILVINAGSSSLKYQIFDTDTEALMHKGAFEGLEGPAEVGKAVTALIDDIGDITVDAVGHRVVHGGDSFTDATLITEDVLTQIQQWSAQAPLHNPAHLAGIRAVQQALPRLPQAAVFDTAFHSTLPRRAYHYALDTEVARRYNIRRYGFHGTSHHYVATEAARFLGRPLSELRLVSLHLGNGASACAIEYGHSTETSMGMTPLEGLVMGSRSGDIDAGAVLALLREKGFDVAEIDTLLNRRSGLRGLSGLSNDLRELEQAAADGHDGARLAIAVFAHRVRKYIGAYAAAMGGLDAIVLTGGIGENSAAMRSRILQRLDFLGVSINPDENQDAVVSHDVPVQPVSENHARVSALVVKTNEGLMIARQTLKLVEQQNETADPGPIPIAVSARHAHLDRETFAALFGEGATPTHYRDLSQPKQFACEEKINLIGPRGRIDGVRLLGPLRSKNQIEVSRTDEFALGVDAPVRDSGRVEGSAPITIEGPMGSVHLPEGLICARRHIHMHTDDAARFGVKNRDEVEVAISGGPRDLTFGDVLVRVSPGYRLEMHIDTDEANAAELTSDTSGELIYTDIKEAAAKMRGKLTRAPDA